MIDILGPLGLVWTLAASAVLVFWSRLNSHRRCLECIDEAAYVNGWAD
jgi:hypothetical protein